MSFNFLKYQRRFFSMQNYRNSANPKVYMDISAGGQSCGRLVFEVKKYYNIIIIENIVIFKSLP